MPNSVLTTSTAYPARAYLAKTCVLVRSPIQRGSAVKVTVSAGVPLKTPMFARQALALQRLVLAILVVTVPMVRVVWISPPTVVGEAPVQLTQTPAHAPIQTVQNS